jgi:putative intracellular protease/amidase
MNSMARFILTTGAAIAALAMSHPSVAIASERTTEHTSASPMSVTDHRPEERIVPYRARFGRSRAVIAIVGENGDEHSTTELTDYVVPYGILEQSDVADVHALATHAGPLKLRPALQLEPQATIEQFDTEFPQGADYVIVPAVSRVADPVLLAWIKAQSAKGGTIVSICDGALVVANTGLMNGHRATAHWDTQELRAKKYPDVRWERNIRYVADGNIVSSAGISAAVPVSLALVEAIGGHGRAMSLAADLGVVQWSSRHDSDVFLPRFGHNLMVFVRTNYTNGWFHRREDVGVALENGVDEIALALTVDAWSRTGRSRAHAIAIDDQPVRALHGLVFLPEPAAAKPARIDRKLRIDADTHSVQALDVALAQIGESYGRATAYGVALDFEYPVFHR